MMERIKKERRPKNEGLQAGRINVYSPGD